MINFFEQTLLR